MVYFIVRMVLLLQSLAKYLEQTLALGSRKATAMQSSSNTSIGLVVKKYWNKMVQAHTLVQQLQSEVRNVCYSVHYWEVFQRERYQCDITVPFEILNSFTACIHCLHCSRAIV